MGMRSCIGFQFALIEAKMVMARLYQRFIPRLADPDYKLTDVQTLTIKPKDLYMRLEPRAEERTHEETEVTARGIEAHGARQLSGLHDLVNQHLRSRNPDHAGEPMNDEQQHRRPEGDRIGRKHDSPADGYADEQQHPHLDKPADIKAVGESTGEAGQKEVWHPVRDDRESGQRGRVKLVEHHLIGDDVLYVVGHHRGGAAQHIDAKIAIGESRERLMRGHGAHTGIWIQ